MAWKGFLKESKLYMNYPSSSEGKFAEWKEQLYFADGSPDPLYPGWTEKERWAAKLKFWKQFPRAWLRFHWSAVCDWFRRQLRRI